MKNFIIMIFCFFCLNTFGQSGGDKKETVIFSRIEGLTDDQINNSGASKLIFISDIKEAEKMAELDIENGNPFLLLIGGIAPVIMATDPEFQKKYGVYFYELGCAGPQNNILTAYNKTIFKYLTKKNGEKWIKEVREDVVGLKNWRKR